MVGLPTGTVTFLFSDVVGSTALLERLGAGYADELGAHRAIVREAVDGHHGEIVDQRGEEVFAVFSDPAAAIDAAVDIQRRHAGRLMRVRIGLHTGEPALTGEGYVGLDVHRAARISAAAYGGQVLCSSRTRELVPKRSVKDLGTYLLKGISIPERLFQLLEPGLSEGFIPPSVSLAVPSRTRRSRGRSAARTRRTLEQLAWETRARLPSTPPGERQEVSRLAACLVHAARSETSAARFCASVDRPGLERRLTAYRGVSLTSKRASDMARTTDRQLAMLDAIRERRASLEQAVWRPTPDSTEIEQAMQALDDAVHETSAAIGRTGLRTHRTLRRGIRRLGDEYLVITYDETGIERINFFDTIQAARDFKDAVKLAEKRGLAAPGGFLTWGSDSPYGYGSLGGPP